MKGSAVEKQVRFIGDFQGFEYLGTDIKAQLWLVEIPTKKYGNCRLWHVM